MSTFSCVGMTGLVLVQTFFLVGCVSNNVGTTEASEVTIQGSGVGSPGMRGWAGRRANLRVLDGQQLTEGATTKVCVYGSDGNSQPYAVLTVASTTVGTVTEVSAQYVEIPADTPLRASFATTTGVQDTTANGCQYNQAQPLNAGNSLVAGHYTAVVLQYSDFFTRECASNTGAPSDSYCGYYPRSNSSLPSGPCAPKGIYLVRDGFSLSNGQRPGTYRVINATSNAMVIASSLQTGSLTLHTNLTAPGPGQSYIPPGNASTMTVCPSYVQCDPRLTALQASDARYSCTRGETAFRLTSLTSPAITSTTRQSTIYVFGRAGQVSEPGTGLFGTEVSVLIATDVSNANP